jgi:hypothetical protein
MATDLMKVFDEPIPQSPNVASVPPRLEDIVMRAHFTSERRADPQGGAEREAPFDPAVGPGRQRQALHRGYGVEP